MVIYHISLEGYGLPLQFIRWIKVYISTAAFSVSVNSSLESFFTSARGIRQDCYISPYLYVILNNVLSLMLNKATEVRQFDYHPPCWELKLTHLSFTDDIFAFTDGSLKSLRGILSVMEQFSGISGLHINAVKSSLFATGQSVSTMLNEAARIEIKVGTLPIKYMGMPLTTKALSMQDCEPLLDKVRGRLLSWRNKCLSYAGMLHLLKSVVSSILNFWSQAFILPKSCLDEIESMCSAFLWSGSPNHTHKAKVAWEDLCCPKEEGGLGLRRLRDSPSICHELDLEDSYANKLSLDLLIQQYLLRYNCLWDVKGDAKGSWMWRKLLKLRPLVYQFVWMEVKDGRTAFLWFDNWLQLGKLIDITGAIGTCYLGVPRNARVCEAVTRSS